MKKYSILFCLFLQMAMAFAQSPEKMSYQAVIRNNNNVLVSNHAVGMRISILQGSATGTAVYIETQTPTTNANGLIAIEIGTGTVVSGTFANIDWANGPYFVKTETDPNGGTAYTLTASNQLLSVPYALYAKKTDTARVAQVAQTALNGIPSGSQHGQTLTNCDGNIVWTYNGQCPAKISSFNCADTVHSGNLYANINSQEVSSTISYSGGNGGYYANQTFTSSGVLGLTANLSSGYLENGIGILKLFISGKPLTSGYVIFNLTIGDKSCIIKRFVLSNPWLSGTVFCSNNPTLIKEVINPITGKVWMDRNLGAYQVPNSINDTLALGDLYQWGRGADGHQCRNNNTFTSTLSLSDFPGNASFILNNNIPYEWQVTLNNNLWQGKNGINNPCPNGFRIPTEIEFANEINSWDSRNKYGAFSSPLKLISGGYRSVSDGSIILDFGYYWSSNNSGMYNNGMYFTNNFATNTQLFRGHGFSVRCIKD